MRFECFQSGLLVLPNSFLYGVGILLAECHNWLR